MELFDFIILVIIFLIIEGLFAGTEIALFSADKIKLKKMSQKNVWGAKTALQLLKSPNRILSTTLLMTALCTISASSLIVILFEVHYSSIPYSTVLSVMVSSSLIIIFAEILPKTFFQKNADFFAARFSFVIRLFYFVFYPITYLLNTLTSKISSFFDPILSFSSQKKETTREELRALLKYGRRDTEIHSDEKKMIRRIFDFKETETQHALIPLINIDGIEASSSIKEALLQFKEHRHSRMPVYSERIDNIIGTVKFSDLLKASDLEQPLTPYIKKAHYAPETQTLEDLLNDMHEEKYELCTVVDEYGGAVGILTLEDVIEEIVGEIEDEHDTNRTKIKQIDEKCWWIQARISINQINETLNLNLPDGDYETIGGFLLQQFGRIPEARSELFFETSSGTLKFIVKHANERSIEAITIELVTPTDEHSSES